VNCYVVYLEWPEKCFRMDAKALAALKGLVPAGSRIIRAKSEAAFLRALPKATHALVWYFREEWFARASRLKVLATPSAGHELLPTKGPKGVFIHFGHFHGDIMAESAVAFIMAWARGFFLKPTSIWPRAWMSERVYDVHGSKAVIVGYGHVGRAIGRKLEALGVEVFGYSRHLKIAPAVLRAKLREADWLVMALPGDTGTDRFLDGRFIAKLPRRCVIVNVGRGTTVDERALFAALRSHRLAGAYLDVRTTEPYRRFGVPGGTAGLPPTPKLDNLVLLPHASAFSQMYLYQFFAELSDDGCL